MNIDILEQTLQALVATPDPESFLYDLLRAYDQPKSSITLLQKGNYNLEKKRPNVVLWKQKLYFRYERHLDLHALIDAIKQDTAITRHSPRFLIVTNMQHLVAVIPKHRIRWILNWWSCRSISISFCRGQGWRNNSSKRKSGGCESGGAHGAAV